MKKIDDNKKSFFLLVLVLGLFTLVAFLFSDGNRMVYEEKEKASDGYEENKAPEEETQSVSAAVEEVDFFADYRMRRDRHRDEEKEFYESILRDDARSEDAKKEAEAALAEVYRIAALEDQVEAILIGRNYRDVIFSATDTISLLILRQEDLSEEEKASLVSFVSAYGGISAESISVFTVD